jgi:hypothetical protein
MATEENISVGDISDTKPCHMCAKPTRLTCSRCKAFNLCSSACLKTFWEEHKWTCSTKAEIKTTEHRRKGLFAKTSFAVGDEIIREKPLFVVPSSCELPYANHMANTAFDNLKPQEREIAFDFSDCKADDGGKSVWGILKTNAIPCGERAGSLSKVEFEYAGLFALASRMNHSCKPNARYVWRPDLKRELVMAMRPIISGEEITVSYVENYSSTAKRKKRLLNSFAFECTCPACTDSTLEDDECSEEIQQLIDRIPEVAQCGEPKKLQSALQMAERALKLMRDVGFDLPVNLGTVHYDAFQMAKHLMNKSKALEHIKAALECAVLSDGSSSPLTKKYQSLEASIDFLF